MYAGQADSLKFKAFHETNDSLKLNKLLNIALNQSYQNPDSAFVYVERVKSLADEKKDRYHLAKSYNIKGIIYDNISKWDSAMLMYDKAIKIAMDGGYEILVASALNNKGLIEWNRGNNKQAVEYYQQSLAIFEKLKSEQGIANNLNNIGLIFWEQQSYADALKYQYQALESRKKLGDNYGISASYANIGLIYSEIKEYDSALSYLHIAQQKKFALGDKKGLAIVLSNMGNLYKKTGEIDSAATYYKQSIAIHRELNNYKLLSANLSALAWCYYLKDELKEAENLLLEALGYAEKLDLLKEKYGIVTRLGDVAYKRGEYQKSADYRHQSLSLYIAIYQMEKDKEIIKIQNQYEASKKEHQIAKQKAEILEAKIKLRKRRSLIHGSLTLSVLLMIIIFLLYRQHWQKRKNLIEKNRLKVNLARAQHLEEIKEQRLRISRDLHDNIGSRLSYIISTVDNYLYAQPGADEKIRKRLKDISDFTKETILELRSTIWVLNKDEIEINELGEKIRSLASEYTKAIAPDLVVVEQDRMVQKIENTVAMNLFRIVQEAVNNSIKYADATKIIIGIKQQNTKVKFEVKDNGRGFDLTQVQSGNGLNNMQMRAREIGADLEIKSSPGNGCSIILYVHFK